MQFLFEYIQLTLINIELIIFSNSKHIELLQAIKDFRVFDSEHNCFQRVSALL